MVVTKTDHISVAVRSLEDARRNWEPLLGRTGPDEVYTDDGEGIRVARYWVGEVGFELMESTNPEGPVARFIAKKGEGVMLVSFRVDDTRRAVADLRDKGYSFISNARGEYARPFRNSEFAFVHPGQLNGVLTEIIDGE
jgi:methylmalonyl-CoA/ethylmalonyl-CoA epimerase